MKLRNPMEDYFHLNLRKFAVESNAKARDVKPNPTPMPTNRLASRTLTGTRAHRLRQTMRATNDNTDPYNSTGRYDLTTLRQSSGKAARS